MQVEKEHEDRPINDRPVRSGRSRARRTSLQHTTPADSATASLSTDQPVPPPTVSPAWMDSITGLDWEIYWSQHASTTTTTTTTDATEAEEVGWYEAKVASRRGTLFRVVFHGTDSTVYSMELSPAVVRPSVRAWIRKSVSVLLRDHHHHSTTTTETTVVHDTRTLGDAAAIRELQDRVRTAFPVTTLTVSGNSNIPPQHRDDLLQLQSQHIAGCDLLEQVRIQLHLRTCLGPLDNDDDEDDVDTDTDTGDQQSNGEAEEEDEEYDDKSDTMDEDDDPYEPTDAYIEYLCQCLQEVDRACIWQYHCWKLFLHLFGDNCSDEANPMEREFLVQCCLGGRQALSSLCRTTDCSKAAAATFDQDKQKRKHEDGSVDDVDVRPHSKRRKGHLGAHFPVTAETNNSNNDSAGLLDHESITAFIQGSLQVDNRTFTQHCGKMLGKLSELIVSPYMTWERRAQFSLGDRDSLQSITSDDREGETTAPDDSDSRQRAKTMGRRGGSSSQQKEFVSLKDLESLIHAAKSDPFLQRFPIAHYVTRLEDKVSSVLEFEKSTWELVSAVLDDTNVSLQGNSCEGDWIQQGLQMLWQEATKKTGTVSNIHPIGRETSSLSRAVIENAMVYREWYLDLIHAETARERVSFVDTLVSRLSKLPPLPTLANSSDLSSKLGQVASRVQSLWAICLDNLGQCNQYQSLLQERKPNTDALGSKFVSVEGVKDLMREMGQLKVISTAEEMLSVRLDVLLWGEEVQQIFGSVAPSYDDVSAWKTSAKQILEGKSKSRQALRAGLRHSSAVEAEIKAFAHMDMDIIPVGGGYSKVNSLFATASEWKKRAIWILRAVANGTTKNTRPVKLIEPKKMRDLIAEHPKLGVTCKEEFRILHETHEAVLEWTSFMQSCCKNDTIGFDSLLLVLREKRARLSPALALRPSWEVIDGLIASLQWYQDAKTHPIMGDDNFQQLRQLLSKGADLVRQYSTKHGISELSLSSSFDDDKLDVSTVTSDPLAGLVLQRLLSEATAVDVFSDILVSKWMLAVYDFVIQHRDPQGSEDSPRTLQEATNLLRNSRQLSRNLEPRRAELTAAFLLEDFHSLVNQAESMEKKVREAISIACSYAHGARDQLSPGGPETTGRSLAELQITLKQWQASRESLSLHPKLEAELKSVLEKLTWLTFLFDVLHKDDTPLARIPLHTLRMLQSSTPQVRSDFGNFALVIDRVERLLSSSTWWLDRVSTLTSQAKKRQTGDTGGSVDIVAAHTLDLENVNQLLHHPILAKVIIPDAANICEALRNTLDLEVGLSTLLEKDFASADKVAIPDRWRSLIGSDGSFLLLRLTGSRLFSSLRRSIEQLESLVPKTIVGTPGIEVLQWLKAVFQWIDKIQASNLPPEDKNIHFTISLSKAKELIALGDALFLTISEDLKKKLGSHRVYVATSKRGKLSVKTKRDGAHHSPGATCIRWCPFLYEALKADLQRYEIWGHEVAAILQSYDANTRGQGIQTGETMEQMLDQREALWLRLHESPDLVVAPSTSAIDLCSRALDVVKNHITEKIPLDSFRRSFLSCFRDSSVLTEQRSRLLDALLARARIAPKSVRRDFLKSGEDIKHLPFREHCRIVLASVLRKVCEKLSITASTVTAVCSVRGWEIENALFDKYQGELGEKQLSPGYEEKVKALKRALSQSDNADFGAKILRNTITAENLAQMDTTEFASMKVKKQREKAEMEAKKARYLTGPVNVTIATVGATTSDTVAGTSTRTTVLPSAGDASIVHGKMIATDAPKLAAAKSAGDQRPPSLQGKGKPESILRNGNTEQLIGMVRKTLAPPPPSLAMATRAPPVPFASSASLQQNMATNDTGGDRFTFTLGKYNFTGALQIEQDSQRVGHGLLPEILKDQGRSSPEQFKSFLEAKLKGRRWDAVTFRVLTSSNSDTIDYKNFYKDFEKKQRVAMFKLAEGSKAFLVTPKFHQFAASVAFAKPTSSYFVVLIKQE